MGKIGVFGGTFNPVHNGHLHIAKSFAAALSLDSVVFIPTKTPPHKAPDDLAPAADRLAMCALALEGTGFAVSDVEIERPGKSYTVHTLELLHSQRPDDELYLLMGEDMFCTVLEWYQPRRICELAVLCAAPRSEDGRARLESYGGRVAAAGGRYRIADIPYLPVSSTEIRARVRRGEPLAGLTPPAVEEYIAAHHFYQGGPDQ